PELEEYGVGRELRRRVEPCGQRRQRAKGNDEENRADQEISLYPEKTHPRQLAPPPDPRGVKAGSHLGPDGGSQSDAAGPLGREAGPSSPPYTERRQAPPSRNEQEITGNVDQIDRDRHRHRGDSVPAPAQVAHRAETHQVDGRFVDPDGEVLLRKACHFGGGADQKKAGPANRSLKGHKQQAEDPADRERLKQKARRRWLVPLPDGLRDQGGGSHAQKPKDPTDRTEDGVDRERGG